jgi:glutamate---cysteine ligase / carboxylate-amine ligase
MKGGLLGELLTQHHGATPHELPQDLRDLMVRLEETLTTSQEPTPSPLPPVSHPESAHTPKGRSKLCQIALSNAGFRPMECEGGRPSVRHHKPRRSGSRRVSHLARDAKFRFGIEEEYFLADARSLRVVCESPAELFDHAHERGAPRIHREFLQSQLEVATRPHVSTADAQLDLVQLRRSAAEAAAEHDLVIMAAGTHPMARWREAVRSPQERYQAMMEALQMIGQRNMLCGMHVHVECPDPRRRVDIMRRMTPYVPLLLALSTSSPFWEARCTGLKGYRLAAYDELPRTGLPEPFRTTKQYDAYVAALVRSGVMQDSSQVWWAMRPSSKYPTLELRAPDCCTRVEDALAIAALYRVLVRHLCLNPEHNSDLGVVGRALAVENKWRAQRYGVQGTFVTEGGALPVGEMLQRLSEKIWPDAEVLDCVSQIEHCIRIVGIGTSADAQLDVFNRNQHQGVDAALQASTRWIVDASVATPEKKGKPGANTLPSASATCGTD